METREMNTRWKRFAEKVAEGLSATEAYLQVGYKSSTRESAQSAASRLRCQPQIRACITSLRRQADAIAREDTTFTIARKLALLARIAETSAARVGEDDPIIQYHRTFKDGSTATRIPCKLRAIRQHSELAGHLDFPSPAAEPSRDTLADFIHYLRNRPQFPIPTAQPSGFIDEPPVSSSRPGNSQKPQEPQQTITSQPSEPADIPPAPDEKALKKERLRALWTPSPQPRPYDGHIPGIHPPRVTILR